jgi:abortive infection bacteriophage resistance protein
VKFDKPPLSLDQQADLLIARGLIAEKNVLIQRLSMVNYYRLSTYLYPFRNTDNSYRENTTLDLVWDRYTFDRKLRLLLLDAIERVEVGIRTRIAYRIARELGPFAYDSPIYLPGISLDTYVNWFEELRDEINRSREPFIGHFKNKYGDEHCLPPIWMAVEVMSFGKTLTLFRGIQQKMKKEIAYCYKMNDEVFLSWLVAINSVRNICAHHSRLIDRQLYNKPKITRVHKHPEWHYPLEIPRDKIFGIMTILQFLLSVDDTSNQWREKVFELIRLNPDIPLTVMGFPEKWRDSPFWTE